ncbi:cation:proton antiporter [Cellulomonas phragmiteti]|uniref:Cation:proton antiporter n=1 Tax=Cellulomonas phragmiteti TaxID=478780 RepID=A0ABQ4DMG1_9CELL|nr:monovalent cation/H(+) antiporter subunit G [Cellulomonas phragmiteti]GIG40528.1 cation:proton antiporter [Cellulomonas phragmiteti]
MIADVVTVVLVTSGCLFVTAGTVGLLRFGDLRSRLHALTKADNVGLGLIVLGLLPQVPHPATGVLLVLVWLLALLAAATNGSLLARDDTSPADGAAAPAPEGAP